MSDYRDGLRLVPSHMHGAIQRYIDQGIPPGHFLSALLSNDFMEAMGRADEDNLSAMRGWATFLYSYAPMGCYGSPAAFRAWIDHRGLAVPTIADAGTEA